MTVVQTLYRQYKRYRSLQTGHISVLPIVILMPHSACNCQCVMCDIWKGNKNLKQLTENDISGLLVSLKKLGTQQVVMSGGEALLNPNFFRFCELINKQGIRITLLTTGITLRRNAELLLVNVNDIIVSLDGDEALHDRIRNIPGAFKKLRDGVSYIKSIDPDFPITARTVIHRLNFRHWPSIIDAAKDCGLDQISFLPADVSSHAFNREQAWGEERQQEILPEQKDLAELDAMVEQVIAMQSSMQGLPFIAESPEKLRNISRYYKACYGLNPFPYKKCNAPWVSAVVEADGTVRPCFFHAPLGNIHDERLDTILNGDQGIRFRKELDMDNNSTCIKCVCSLHLSPRSNIN